LLWRLHLRGVNAGDRWEKLADLWERRIEEAYYAFNDAHAMMAFVATGRASSIEALLGAMESRVAGGGTNGRMTWEVGLPLCRALEAFGNGDYAKAAEILQPLRLIAHRFGGSHAQRDLLHLTLIESAMRARRLTLARALAAERTALKPGSAANWQLTTRTLKLQGDEEAAQAANRRSEQAAGTSRSAEWLASAA
jgi:hypothetical protein